MRDILITLLVLGSIPYIFKRPYLGVLVWSWLAYMNPHRLAWGFAYSMPFSMIIALATIMAFAFGKENKKLPMTGITSLIIFFLIWQTITTMASSNFDGSLSELIRVYKIQFVIILTLIMFQHKERIIQLVTVIALSIGFFGIKGGVFAIATGLTYTVWGPADTFIEGNNELGLALLMVIPLFYFLHGHYKNKWIKLGILFSIGLMLASVASTYSRGAFLAALCMMFFLWLKTKNKIVTGTIGAVLLTVIFLSLPGQWFDRINTIENYEEDASAQGRIIAWHLAIKIANDNITGGGFGGTFTTYNYLNYFQELRGTDAHSIYFEVLGEQGYIGLIVFLLMFYLGWRNGNWIIKKTKNIPELEWANRLSAMLQVSLVAYGSGGAFLGLAYFDLPYHILALIVVTRIAVERELNAKRKEALHSQSTKTPLVAQVQET